MDTPNLFSPEVIAGTLTIIGGIVLLFNRIGLISFGKKKCNPELDECPDPACKQNVRQNIKHIKEIRKDVKKLTPKVIESSTNIEWIRTYIERNGFK